MHNLSISIIIPVYNTEQYLERCIKSIVNQTYKNIEIILVNDGSFDNSPFICKEWANKDTRIKIINKENGGLASARNAGLNMCSGDYIAFVDSDDYVENNYIEMMLNEALLNNADVVETSLIIEEDNKKKFYEIRNGTVNKDTLVTHLLQNDYKVFSNVYNKIYKKEILHSIRFDEELLYGEDTLFTFLVIVNSNKYVQLNKALYHYVKRNNSLISGDFKEYKMLSLLCAIKITDICKKDYPNYYDLSILHQSLKAYYLLRELLLTPNWRKQYINQYQTLINNTKLTSYKDYKKVFGIKKAFIWYLVNNHTKIYEKLLILKSNFK